MKNETRHKIIFFICVYVTLLCIYGWLVSYQHSRYAEGKFTCVQFTNEMISVFKKFGITSYQVVGTDKENSSLAHSWVGIPFGEEIIHFDPQSLLPFNPNDDYVNITVNYYSCK